MTDTTTKLLKRTSQAFGKKIFLLGVDRDDVYYWLECASWDCDWYWGFGYVETYTNNTHPEHAKDIETHQHFDSLFLNGNKCAFDMFKDFFAFTPLTDDEIWKLCDYMKTFYTLKKAAELFRYGYSWQTEKAKMQEIKKQEYENEINNKMMPTLFGKIAELLQEE